jgi:hypothetical protein
MLQNAPVGAQFKRALVHPEHNVHLIPLHFHPLDQSADNVAPARPIRLVQAFFHLGMKIFQAPQDQR